MDYEQRYKEALERAKKMLASKRSVIVEKQALENIFPELKESEEERDKRMWNLIKKYAHSNISDMVLDADHITRDQLESWLEKQGEKTNPYSGISFEYNGHTWGMCARDNGVDILLDKQLFTHLEKQSEQKYPCEDCPHPKLNCGNFPCIEKRAFEQGKSVFDVIKTEREQNPTDKVESKFKVGDWITNGCLHYKIIDVLENDYIVDTGFAKRKVIPIRQEKYYHLWTIRDAKDGDVLVDTSSDKMIIFHKIGNETWNDVIDYYVAAKDGYFNIPKGVQYWSSIHTCKLKPATADQRDLLFEQIGKDGYIWDDHAKMLICSTDKKSK